MSDTALLLGSRARSATATATVIALLLAAFLTPGLRIAAGGEPPLLDKIEFNRDIRPIFSDTCFKCHGPDAKARKGKLRLDLREQALESRKGRTPILPGNSAASESFRRLVTTNLDDLMPPADSGKKLSSREIALIRKWIDQGAEYQAHWAYAPMNDVPVPKPGRLGPGRNPIDRFLLARLEREGLRPVDEAPRSTLFRRVSLDLTGIPPVGESLPRGNRGGVDAYEQEVDRLLASPRFGERMAVWWLDLVRYADSVGYHSDTPMSVWPYRDYVIKSFNANLPFDRFTVEQIAGDLLPEATQQQKVASAYNRLLQTTEEGGGQAKEYEFIYACDRVRSAATTWLGATMMCSQCHDHKYDPFTMRDFYSMAAFFADLQEPAVGPRGRGMLLSTPEQAEQIRKFDASIGALRQRLDTQTPELTAAQEAWEQALAVGPDWKGFEVQEISATSGTTLTREPEGIVRAGGKLPDKETYRLVGRVPIAGVKALRVEALAEPGFPSGGPGLASNGNFVLTGVTAEVESAPGGTNRPIEFATALADFSQDGFPAGNVLDKKPETGWAVLPQTGKSHTLVLEAKGPIEAPSDARFTVTLRFESQFGQHLIGRLRLSATTSTNAAGRLGLPEKVRNALAVRAGERSEEQRKEVASYYRGIAPLLDPARKELAAAEGDRRKLVDSIPSCLVSESGKPREVRIHARGNWQNDTGPVMEPGVPEALGRLGAKGRATRLDLARWLVSPGNPVTSRVTVNRVWKLFFGTGLSKTLYDSGSQGELPTHPELLDWLAREFVQSGWDLKHLVRLIVTSDAYRRSSVATPELRERDPYNRLLARQTPFRLDAEFIRDTALAVSGLLVEKVGGASVFPYQPAGYWAALNFPTREWQNSQGEGLYRRGLYTHWQRTFLHPSLAAFDACSREEAAADRPRSNIPQQALALLNDPTYVEAARGLAERTLGHGGKGTRGRIRFAWNLALNRPPTPAEVGVLSGLLEGQKRELQKNPKGVDPLLHVGARPVPQGIDPVELAAWTEVARTILNLHETITRE